MRVRVEYDFYLNFSLPRFDEQPVSTLHLNLSEWGADAFVQWWDHKSPLFRGDLGETLRSARLAITDPSVPEHFLTHEVRNHCLDRLTVVIEWMSDSDPTLDSPSGKFWLDRAVRTANLILDHWRVVADAPQIRRIARHWNTDRSEYELMVPHTESWHNMDNDSALGKDGVNGVVESGALVLNVVNPVSWTDFVTSLASGGRPALYRSLLVDATESLQLFRLREATLAAASACDIRANIYKDTQRALTKTQADRLVKRPNTSFAERYFHLLTSATTNRSLLQDDPHAFKAVQDLYQERSNLIHDGMFGAVLSGKSEVECNPILADWIACARAAIDWLDQI